MVTAPKNNQLHIQVHKLDQKNKNILLFTPFGQRQLFIDVYPLTLISFIDWLGPN